ncbi:MaoC family dehydratase [Zhihengliuella flava]|uniref:Acyl dehydratase n=1 Tax=Zhihengliuella flava TaxID=1285193 RepID=A0A931DAB0_9MICC|nr:MaoC family dehydratase [Zhihengliuella flava]MBG6083836.1 acyl dehydratase [Zhihengliuella flava]
MSESHGLDASPGQRAGRRIEQRGRYLDELQVGDVYVHSPGRTITETDNVLFTTMTMNTQALHLDAAWSAQQPFGQRLVNSMFTLATLIGQSVTQITQGTIVAQLGLSEIRFPAPLFHGDTLTSETEILSVRPSSSRPGQGVVTMKHTGYQQDGTVVAEATRSCLMWERAAHESALAGEVQA